MKDFVKPHKATPSDISSFFIGTLPASSGRILPRSQLATIRRAQKRYLLSNAGISLAVVLLAFWENNEYHKQKDPGEGFILSLRTLMAMLTGLQLALVLQTARLYTKELRTRGDYITDHLRWCLLELALSCVVSLPFYDFSVQMTQLGASMSLSLDDILVPLVCLRLLHVLKCTQYLSHLSSPRSDFYLSLHSVPSRAMFILKGLFVTGLLRLLLISMLANMLLCGSLLRIFERSLSESNPMDYVWSGFWLAEVSNYTIGYGDLVPQTHIGRTIIVFCIFIGILSLAFVVMWVNDQLAFNDWQLRLFATLLAKRHANERLYEKAVVLIQRLWRLHRKRRQGEPRQHETFQFYLQLRSLRFERTLCKLKYEPTVKDQMYYFERYTRSLFAELLKSLPAVCKYEDIVSATQSQRFAARVARQTKLLVNMKKRAVVLRTKGREVIASEASEFGGEEESSPGYESPRRHTLLTPRISLKLGRANAIKNMKRHFLSKQLTLVSRTMEGESPSEATSAVAP